MDIAEIQQSFKKYKSLVFLPSDKNIVFVWGTDKATGLPYDKIYIGRHGAPRPEIVLTPYDIASIEYTRPGLFKAGVLSVVGMDGKVLFATYFKDKSNMKTADKFNECLALYKRYGLGE